ncbi:MULTISPECIES: M20 family metallopeptidase [unclassified Microbacterium]|uniref:M20 metallopeptidase family protein n=1 Tax=unclassified Microbacterium TaxID=2609290 RepID=UPI000EA8FF53|nr:MULTISPECIES: M20 family metallopeptidase [unclassified Microbacterium]MBT2486405.1 amidohydrolase [Microbacterium sp. ISL-108]RKN69107.1 amidohydrolase [Microbacterium sp. CGR2]
MTLLDDAQVLLPELLALRRAIHADPELGIELPRTQRRVLDALEPLGLEVVLGEGLSSITAVVRGAHPGPTVLLRADMDALPLVEDTGLDYAASGGRMHACGHDLHVAGLVGAAHLLAGRREELHGDVLLMFQPGEELGDGAKRMLAEGLLETTGSRPVAAFGIHVVPGEYGVFSTRPGALMAGAIEVEITITGAGGHASAPHLTRDPVPVAAELVTALQTFVTRRFDVFDPVVLSVTQLHAGGPARNIISDTATLVASVRVLSHESSARVQAELPALAREIAAAHDCTAQVEVTVLCAPTVNDARAVERVRATLQGLFGEERVWETAHPVMGSEDFSFVLEQVPGAFLFLRATPAEVDLETASPNHSPTVVFDDAILADQAAALAAFALETLAD